MSAHRLVVVVIRALITWLLIVAAGTAASAQTTFTYSNTTTTNGTISETVTPCTNPLTRDFSVTASYVVADVNIGIRLSHSYRGDLRLYLVSPTGTVVTLVENVGGTQNNLNVLFDSASATSITTHTSNNDSATSGPPYQRTFAPQQSLSAFNGQNANGVWQLRICDSLVTDAGAFSRADLYIQEAPQQADLSLTKTVSNANPTNGAAIAWTLTVSNAAASTLTATGITVSDALPAGFVFSGATGTGSFNATTGIWTVGSLAPGASATIVINGTVAASSGAVVTNVAEIATSSASDLDSTPGNSVAGEDDQASRSFTVSGTRTAGVAPTLLCPVGRVTFDWDTIIWNAGTTANSYTLSPIGPIGWTITNQGAFMSNATYGGQSPAEQTAVTGGYPAGQQSLFIYSDFATISQVSMTTITLGSVVSGAQFEIFDVDFNSGQFADRVRVTGLRAGVPVTPILTNGLSNYVVGNSAFGDTLSADTSAAGNLTVTFTAPIDTIIIEYGNHALSPPDPGGQAITIADIAFCLPDAAVSIAKSSVVLSDRVASDEPMAIPGALVRYCLLVTNDGPGSASNLVISDAVPPTLTFVPGSLRSGTACATTATTEDDNADGTDETDPYGASVAGTTISARATTLATNAAFAITFDATIN